MARISKSLLNQLEARKTKTIDASQEKNSQSIRGKRATNKQTNKRLQLLEK